MKIPLYRHYFNFEPNLKINHFRITIKNLSPFSIYNKSIQIGEEIFTTGRLFFHPSIVVYDSKVYGIVNASLMLKSSIYPRSKIKDESIVKTFLEQNDDIIFKELIMPLHDTLKELGFENWNNTPTKNEYKNSNISEESFFVRVSSSHEAYNELMKFWKPFYRMKTIITDTD